MRREIPFLRVLACLAVLLAGGCKNKFYGAPKMLKPANWILDQMPKGMSPVFNYGWQHGCESGLATMTNSYYRYNYRFKMDPEMRTYSLNLGSSAANYENRFRDAERELGSYRVYDYYYRYGRKYRNYPASLPANAPERKWCELGIRDARAGHEAGKQRLEQEYGEAKKRHRLAWQKWYAKKSHADDYYTAWKDSFNFCRHYGYGRTRESDNRTRLPNRNFTLHDRVGIHPVFTHGLLNFWGPGMNAARPLKNVGIIAGNSTIGDDFLNWDYSDGYGAGTKGLYDMLNWNLAPEEGFAW
jgi:hypothetical protein